MSNDNLQDYNEVLSTISTCLSQYNAEYCVIAGDLNTDLSRVNSGNTISLKAFVDEENLFLVWISLQAEYHIHSLALEITIL